MCLLEIQKDPDCNAECDEGHGISYEVQSGSCLDSRLRLTFQRYIDAGPVVRVVVPRAVAMAESTGVLCEQRKDTYEISAGVQYKCNVKYILYRPGVAAVPISLKTKKKKKKN
jgi:hypothetical protein